MSKINFRKLLDETEPLERNNCNLRINNIVGTVKLLNDKETLCLESIACLLGGLVKYAPKKFAAAILRVKDFISTTTCLIFRSAKIVVVGALTKHHSLYACQMYRQMIEEVTGVYSHNGNLGIYDLIGRTQFKEWRVTNIVADYNVGHRPDLKLLTEMLADVSNWTPELFPGMKLKVWLKTKEDCKCIKKKKNKSCKCTSRVLLFDTGKAVFTGCKSLSDVNITRQRIQELLIDTDFHDKDDEPMRKKRFESRREKIIKAAYVEFLEWKKPKRISEPIPTNDPVFEYLKPQKQIKRTRDNLPIINACISGQYENVAFIASFDEDQLQAALEFVHKYPNDVTEEILELIEKCIC